MLPAVRSTAARVAETSACPATDHAPAGCGAAAAARATARASAGPR